MHSPDPAFYDPAHLEAHWQTVWDDRQAFASRGTGTPYYALEMLPYPSGALHMGHVRNYAIGDAFARYHWMRGFDVLHPMGWDALGLPAENQAILENVAPQVRTPKNIVQMKAQMQRLGLGYDWQREIATYLPAYYRWNQWFFLQLLARDLVYRRQSTVNWCPGCNTVLANEQVRDDNSCWRGHPGVSQRSIPEWAFRITRYAEALLADLDQLTDWPERIVSQQRHWLGRSEGACVRFAVAAPVATPSSGPVDLEIFTTRVDTLYGCTYLVLAPEHPAALSLTTAAQRPAVTAFVARMAGVERQARTAVGGDKEGIWTGAQAHHPLTQALVPIWLANFVLADYGTGAVMAVPAHDVRDFEFAAQYGLPIRAVVQAPAATDLPYTGDGVLVDSGPYTGLASAAARQQLTAALVVSGQGAAQVTWHLRDWGFSRQRYWGTPIPVVHCPRDGVVPVAEADLPVLLPDFAEVSLTGEGGAPLARLPSFRDCVCPRCGGPAEREVETMDTFVDSAWYFARYLSPTADDVPFTATAAARWLPVDVYVGGPEHAVMHLLYFRFWTKVMRDLGLVQVDEPVRRLITQGMVNAAAYRCPQHGYLPAEGRRSDAPGVCPKCAAPLQVAIEKMSKSKYNGIDPMALIDQYGADAARLYTLFAAPPEKDLEWSSEGVEGVARFLARTWRLYAAQRQRRNLATATLPTVMGDLGGADAAVRRATHRTLARIGEEMQGRNHFNTAIAAMMELVNTLHEHGLHRPEAASGRAATEVAPAVAREALLLLAQMLAPFAPHLAEEIWHGLGGAGLVVHSAWPEADPSALVRDLVTVAVQVNGKLRGQLQITPEATAEEVVAQALAEPQVQRYLAQGTIKKHIYVPGRLLNFVVRSA